MQQMLRALWREDCGQDMTEWALLICFVALAAMVVLGVGSNSIRGIATDTQSQLDAAAHTVGN